MDEHRDLSAVHGDRAILDSGLHRLQNLRKPFCMLSVSCSSFDPPSMQHDDEKLTVRILNKDEVEGTRYT